MRVCSSSRWHVASQPGVADDNQAAVRSASPEEINPPMRLRHDPAPTLARPRRCRLARCAGTRLRRREGCSTCRSTATSGRSAHGRDQIGLHHPGLAPRSRARAPARSLAPPSAAVRLDRRDRIDLHLLSTVASAIRPSASGGDHRAPTTCCRRRRRRAGDQARDGASRPYSRRCPHRLAGTVTPNARVARASSRAGRGCASSHAIAEIGVADPGAIPRPTPARARLPGLEDFGGLARAGIRPAALGARRAAFVRDAVLPRAARPYRGFVVAPQIGTAWTRVFAQEVTESEVTLTVRSSSAATACLHDREASAAGRFPDRARGSVAAGGV